MCREGRGMNVRVMGEIGDAGGTPPYPTLVGTGSIPVPRFLLNPYAKRATEDQGRGWNASLPGSRGRIGFWRAQALQSSESA